MKIAIDVSPLKQGRFLQHRVRGTGLYIENLKKSLLQYYPDNRYIFFTRGENLPKDTDLVHYLYFEPFFLTLPIYKRYKIVVTVHDLTPLVFPKQFPAGIRGKIKWQLQKLALKNSSAVITDSFSSKKDIIKYANISDAKIHVIYLAAGEEFQKCQMPSIRQAQDKNVKCQMLRKKYGLSDKFVLYVGDVTWNKNLPRLIEAVKKIKIPLVLVGKAITDKDFDRTNPWNQDIVKVQELIEKDKNILCLGFIPTDDLVMIYNLATVFVMPSLYEGFGLPILEAMSCGCPVVTSKGGSIPEIAGNAAFFVDAYNVESIAEGIKKVFINEDIRKELSRKGLESVKRFSWKKTASETLEAYRQVLR